MIASHQIFICALCNHGKFDIPLSFLKSRLRVIRILEAYRRMQVTTIRLISSPPPPPLPSTPCSSANPPRPP
jgi:hypothetical protein